MLLEGQVALAVEHLLKEVLVFPETEQLVKEMPEELV
jgi:hypothetical protein